MVRIAIRYIWKLERGNNWILRLEKSMGFMTLSVLVYGLPGAVIGQTVGLSGTSCLFVMVCPRQYTVIACWSDFCQLFEISSMKFSRKFYFDSAECAYMHAQTWELNSFNKSSHSVLDLPLKWLQYNSVFYFQRLSLASVWFFFKDFICYYRTLQNTLLESFTETLVVKF